MALQDGFKDISSDGKQTLTNISSNTLGWRLVNGAFKTALPMVLSNTEAMLRDALIKNSEELKSNYRFKNLFILWQLYEKAVKEWTWHLHTFKSINQDNDINKEYGLNKEQVYAGFIANKNNNSFKQMEQMKRIATTICIHDPAYLDFVNCFWNTVEEYVASEMLDGIQKGSPIRLNGYDYILNIVGKKEVPINNEKNKLKLPD